MSFRPLHDRVVVRRVGSDEKTAGGIIIPDTAQEKPSEGEIVSVGSGARAEDGSVTPMDVKARDRVDTLTYEFNLGIRRHGVVNNDQIVPTGLTVLRQHVRRILQ